MVFRSLLLATSLLAACATTALGQTLDEVIASPVLRANVTVAGDVVRIGDVIDNAGPAAQIAIYRAPDLGTVGSLSAAKIIATLRTHQVIGVDTRNIQDVTITRLSRSVEAKDIETQVALALEHRNGLGDAANLSLTFDRDVQSLRLDAANSGALDPISVRYDPRSTRFDVTFSIGNDANAAVTKLRFTGSAVETVEAAVLARGVDSKEVLKSSDVIVERRPKAEVGNDVASRDRAVGMQARRQLRAGQALRVSDLTKPDLVSRDQAVTLVYESAGLYLTIRGKAMEAGTEGDVVNVINLQSKRTVSGVVVGRGQVAVSVPAPRLPPASEAAPAKTSEAAAPVAVAANEQVPVSRKAE
ncbi:MAG: flagella basal body P-ring formation protein FlgA [Tardiphaga sp.]|uniref:flagellar basal body P-ring formation chaperone FlgA n=1 Tax=Tardiphaga sp. TaxID=1926292 RepID=UPI00261F47AC|nr:flagellar basal body P-ring formation chaperone FlgA [Tardiphaga sp.]MDB5502052.1 flagella basal body P-ring formation protein FlgA [Tardiphaga sp.]